MISKHSKIKIIGVGKVGSSILQTFAQQGFSPVGIEIDQKAREAAIQNTEKNLSSLVEKGKMSDETKKGISSRMTITGDLSAAEGADVVIEAVFEEMNTKKDLFKKMDQMNLPIHTLLLTNTSSLSVTEISSVTRRPDRCAGMHFFNPVTIMKLVEVIRGAETSMETVETVKELARLLGKVPIVSKDSPAFIVNRMLNALACEAARIVEEGVGSIEDVDIGVKLGLGHPMGPFELFDYLNAVGLLVHVTEYMEKELGSRFRMPVWVKNLVRAGRLGKARGKGFYDYTSKTEA
jgi:3-hydroxybutyryl-CoA dehydrogenase